MNDFIGNHIKFIAEWGQLLMAGLILFGLFCLYLLGKNNRFYLPKGLFGWVGAFFALVFVLLASLIFARITVIKPGAMAIIGQLEGVKNAEAPPLSYQWVSDGSQHELSEYKGKVVLLNYWATWCRPCLKEMPDLNRLQKELRDEGLIVLAVSDESIDRIQTYAKKRPFEAVPVSVSSFDWVNLGSERPATFLIDREGIVRDYFTGPYDYEYFKTRVLKYL